MSAGKPAGWSPRPLPEIAATRNSRRWTIARPAQLTAARKELGQRLTTATLPAGVGTEDVDRLLLAFEELASNGLRHSGAPVEVRVLDCDRGWLIDVSDSRPERLPVPAVDRDPAQGGLGLHLIARLSADFGWTVVGPRKHVWATVLTS